MNIDWGFWLSIGLVCAIGWGVGWALCTAIDEFFHWRKMRRMIQRLGPCSCGELHPEKVVRLDLGREIERLRRQETTCKLQ